MAIHITSFPLGGVNFQSGFGIPNHLSTKGSIYVDLYTAIEYINRDGLIGWAIFYDSYDIFDYVLGLTGGTISGNTIVIGGLTGNTISANTLTANNGYISGLTATSIESDYVLSDTISATTILGQSISGNSLTGTSIFSSILSASSINSGATINGLGYTPENVSNKATNLISPDNTKYPTTLAVSTALAGKQDTLTNPITGTGVSGQVSFFNGTTTQAGDNGLVWDNINKRLGIGLTGPTVPLDLNGRARIVTSSGSYNPPLFVENTGSASVDFKNVATFAGTRGNASNFDDNTNIGIWQKSNIINNYGTVNFFNSTGNLSAFFGAQFLNHNTSNANLIFGTANNGVNSEKMRISPTGNVGIGTTSPQAKLDVRAQGALATDIAFRVRNSNDTRNFLVVNGAGDVYNNGAGGVGSNTFFGENVGRLATGINNTAFGVSALRNNTTGINNTAIGFNSLQSNTVGSYNTAIGFNVLTNYNNSLVNTYMTAIGGNIGNPSLTGSVNTFIGWNNALELTTGSSNIGIGYMAFKASGNSNNNVIVGNSVNRPAGSYSNNTLIGNEVLYSITSGDNNVGLGRSAGSYIADGTTTNTNSSNSIFIGNDIRALAVNQTNQIVIGYQAIGLGSNSVVLGNTSITRTQLRGQVIMDSFASAPTGIEGAIYYDSTTKKHYGFDGTSWYSMDADIVKTNRQSASYTLTFTDRSKLVEMDVATANNLTIPLNSSVAFPIGTKIDVVQYGAGQTTFVPASGVTIRSANNWLKINARYGAATLTKIGTDEWYLWGNLNA